jgi:predicted nucleotidyltransferase
MISLMLDIQYPRVSALIEELSKRIQASMGDRLKGLYIFGSLVAGDFDVETSDIDLLAVVESGIDSTAIVALKEMHDEIACRYPEWEDRVEVAYVSVDAIKNFKTHPSRIARISPGEPLHYRDMDIQWLMDWYQVQEQGATVFGAPPQQYVPHVSTEEFIESLKNRLPCWRIDIREARTVGHQSFIILSLCRSLYSIQYHQQISKVAAGEWASREFPEWSRVVRDALQWHGSSDKSDSLFTQAEAIGFVEFAIGQART